MRKEERTREERSWREVRCKMRRLGLGRREVDIGAEEQCQSERRMRKTSRAER